MRSYLLAILVACTADASAAQGDSATAPIKLQEALALARAHDPALVAARLRAPIDRANRALAGERPNPEARYEHTNELPHDLFSLAQPLELGGKRGRRIAAAEAGLRTGEAELAQAEAQAELDTRRAYFAVLSGQRRSGIAREIQELAARGHRVASEREDVGDVSKLDVLQAHLLLAAADNEATSLLGELAATRAELNIHIGQPLEAPTQVADDLAPIPPPEVLEAEWRDNFNKSVSATICDRSDIIGPD